MKIEYINLVETLTVLGFKNIDETFINLVIEYLVKNTKDGVDIKFSDVDSNLFDKIDDVFILKYNLDEELKKYLIDKNIDLYNKFKSIKFNEVLVNKSKFLLKNIIKDELSNLLEINEMIEGKNINYYLNLFYKDIIDLSFAEGRDLLLSYYLLENCIMGNKNSVELYNDMDLKIYPVVRHNLLKASGLEMKYYNEIKYLLNKSRVENLYLELILSDNNPYSKDIIDYLCNQYFDEDNKYNELLRKRMVKNI